MMKENCIKAKIFYNKLKINRGLSRHKLVNGLFIVKYLNKEICIFVGYFHKIGSVFNKGKYNFVEVKESKQLFKNKKLTITSLGFWKKLNIGFKEQPIETILK